MTAATPSLPARRPSPGWLAAAVAAAALSAPLLVELGPLAPLVLAAGLALLVRAAANPRFGVLAALTATLLVPLPMSVTLGSVELSPGRLANAAVLLGWLAAMRRADGPRPRRSGLEAGVFGLLSAMALSLVVNAPHLGTLALLEGARRILVYAFDYFAFFYVAVSVLAAGERHLRHALRVVGAAVGLIGLLGALELVIGRNVFLLVAPLLPPDAGAYVRALAESAQEARGSIIRVQSTLTGPNQFGAVVTMGVPLLIHLTVTARSALERNLAAVGAAVTLLVGLFTASRSVVLGLLLVFAVTALGSAGTRTRALRLLAALLALAAITLASAPGLREAISTYFLGLAGLQERSVSARAQDWSNIAEQFERTPLLGSGPATWTNRSLVRGGEADVGRRVPVDPTFPPQRVLDNTYLQTLGETGAAGLLALLVILAGGVVAALLARRRALDGEQRSLATALLAGLLAYGLFAAAFDMLSFDAPTKLYLFVLAATVVIAGQTRTASAHSSPPAPARGLDPVSHPEITETTRLRLPERVDHTDVPGLLRLGWRWWTAVVVGAVLAGALAGVLVDRLPAQWTAEQVLVFDQPRLVAEGGQGMATADKLGSLMPTYARLAESDVVLDQVRERSGVTLDNRELRERITVSRVPEEIAVRIEAEAEAADEASALTAATADAFTDWLGEYQADSGVPPELRFQVLPLRDEVVAEHAPRHLRRTVALAALLGAAFVATVALVARAARREE